MNGREVCATTTEARARKQLAQSHPQGTPRRGTFEVIAQRQSDARVRNLLLDRTNGDITAGREDGLAVRAPCFDISNDVELLTSLLEIDMQADLAVDKLDHLVDRQKLGAELLPQRRKRKRADFVPRRRAVIVIVDVDAVRAPAHVDLHVIDAHGNGAAVAFGGCEARGAAFAPMGVDQRTQDCLRCPA